MFFREKARTRKPEAASRKSGHRSLFGKAMFASAIFQFLLVGSIEAQDLDSRHYVNLPSNQNFFRIAYGLASGGVNITPTLPLQDADLIIKGGSIAYMRSLDLGGKSATFDAWMPYFCASGSAVLDGAPRERSVCGNGDAKIRFTYNFIGAPALSLSEFVKQEKQIVVGTSVQVDVPTGQYNDDVLLNIGANRWVIKPEIGVSIPWREWSFEFSAGFRIFTDNEDYVGNSVLEQNPLYNLQLHVSRDLTPRQWIGINTNYFFGGETYRNGSLSQIEQKNSRFGITWFVVLNPRQVLKIVASTGVITRVGNDSNNLTAEWIYRWD
jgi:hypothetical protein